MKQIIQFFLITGKLPRLLKCLLRASHLKPQDSPHLSPHVVYGQKMKFTLEDGALHALDKDSIKIMQSIFG